MSSSKLADVAQKGFADAAIYDRYRPSYPPEAVESLLKQLRVSGLDGARILDLAAGTGKFTEILAQREEEFEIIAVEPHDGMRSELDKKQLRGVMVLAGDAETVPLESQSVDAAIVAQAFHWFANDEALQEIHRVLSPAGVLGLIWNIDANNAPKSWTHITGWESKMRDITWSFDDQRPRFRNEQWRQVFDKQLATTPFTIQAADPVFSLPLGEDSLHYTCWLDREAIWERYHTISHIAVLRGKELEDVKRKVFEAMEGPDVEMNGNGQLALHGYTIWAWTTAVPGGTLKSGG